VLLRAAGKPRGASVLSSSGDDAAAIAAPSAGLLWLLGCGVYLVAAIQPAAPLAAEAHAIGNVLEVREMAGPVTSPWAGVGAAATGPWVGRQRSPPAGPVFGIQLPHWIRGGGGGGHRSGCRVIGC
jgi:hypothetical protein